MCFLGVLLLDSCGDGTISLNLPDAGKRKDSRKISYPNDAANNPDNFIDYLNYDNAAPVLTDGGTISNPDTTTSFPTEPGLPCVLSQCGGNLICHAGTCRRVCSLTTAECNEVTTECNVDETCVESSSFSGACVPATKKYLETCSGNNNDVCEQGLVCVSVDGKPSRCYLLSKSKTVCMCGTYAKMCGITNPGNCMFCDESDKF